MLPLLLSAAIGASTLLQHTVRPCLLACHPLRVSRSRSPRAVLASADGEPNTDDEGEEDDYLDELDDMLTKAAAGQPVRPRNGAGKSVAQGAQVSGERDRGLRGSLKIGDGLEIGRSLYDEILASFEAFADRPSQQFLLGLLALLLGFYASHGQVLGGGDQGGRWEYVSGAVATFVVERVSRSYHSRSMATRSPRLKLLNAFNVGFMYGIVLDALKFGG